MFVEYHLQMIEAMAAGPLDPFVLAWRYNKVWITQQGEITALGKLTTTHLLSICNFLNKRFPRYGEVIGDGGRFTQPFMEARFRGLDVPIRFETPSSRGRYLITAKRLDERIEQVLLLRCPSCRAILVTKEIGEKTVFACPNDPLSQQSCSYYNALPRARVIDLEDSKDHRCEECQAHMVTHPLSQGMCANDWWSLTGCSDGRLEGGAVSEEKPQYEPGDLLVFVDGSQIKIRNPTDWIFMQ